MLDLFERAESLINRVGRQPWVIHTDVIFPSERKYGSAFSGIDDLARAFTGIMNFHLTQAHLEEVGELNTGFLGEALEYLDISASVVATQLRIRRTEYSANHEGLIRQFVNASGGAQVVASSGAGGCASKRADACNADDVADLAYATLQAFVACKPLWSLFEINDHPRKKGTSGLGSLERSLAPPDLGVFFKLMLNYMGLEEDNVSRETAVIALREMIATTSSCGYTSAQTVALAGLAGIWCDRTLAIPIFTDGSVAERRSSLERFVQTELQKLARWLNKKEPATILEHKNWLLETLPTISFKLAGW